MLWTYEYSDKIEISIDIQRSSIYEYHGNIKKGWSSFTNSN